MPSFVLSLLISTVAAVLIVLVYPTAAGQFTIPLVLAGGLLGRDGVEWLRGRTDTFDPAGLLGLFSFIYLVVSPLLQVGWDYWANLPYLTYDQNWMLIWAVLHMFGLIAYRFIMLKPLPRTTMSVKWEITHDRFWPLLLGVMAVALAAQIAIVAKFGGVSGMTTAFTLRQELGSVNYDPFKGMGVIMLFADSFKYLLAVLVVYAVKDKPYAKNIGFLAFLVVACGAIFLLFGGLRGSRGATVYAVFYLLAVYHFWVRPITRKEIILGALGLWSFLTTYYWYKFSGLEGLEAIFDPNLRDLLTSGFRTENDKYVLVRDLGRMDFQVIAIKAILTGEQPISWGRSYLTAPFSIIPANLMPIQPASFTKEKVELIMGYGSYIHNGPRQTTMLLGQFGEMLVNFWLFGVILFFLLLTTVVRWGQRWLYYLPSNDARLLLLPWLILLPIQLFMYDANLLVMFYFKVLFLTMVVLFFSVKRKVVT